MRWRARGVSRSRDPGPRPTTERWPRAGTRPMAIVASGVLCLVTTRSAPWASTEASETLGVPTSRATTSEGVGTCWAASSSAEWVRYSNPRSWASLIMPSSPAFTSWLVRIVTDPGASPASARVSSSRDRRWSTSVPLLHPMPTTRERGCRTTVGRSVPPMAVDAASAVRSETMIRAAGSLASSLTFLGSGGSGHGCSRTTCTGRPAMIEPVTPATSPS